jgi:hypothetical protein
MDIIAAESSLDWKSVRGRFNRRKGDMDGRTSAAQRIRKVAQAFAADLGGAEKLSPAVMVKVRRAAELVVAAEELRAKAMRGELTTDVGLLALVRLEGLADRSVRRLRLEHKREQNASPDLAAYLAGSAPRSSDDEGSSS